MEFSKVDEGGEVHYYRELGLRGWIGDWSSYDDDFTWLAVS